VRYERKDRIEAASYGHILNELLCSPLGFKAAFPDRKVNRGYYDDINYTAYNDNLLGISNRVKYRVRWYGDTLQQVVKPILEKKIKTNMLGDKVYHDLADFDLALGAPEINTVLSYKTNCLYPHVIVRYNRSYFVSADSQIRATIDRNLEYINLISGRVTTQRYYDDALILEIKYDQNHQKEAIIAMQALSYRMTKNSKYVSAMRLYLQ